MPSYALAGVAGSSLLYAATRHGIGGFALLGVGALAGLAYYVVNVTLVIAATAVVERRRPLAVFRETAAWLAPHYVVYGILAAGIVLADQSLGLLGILVFAMPAAAMLIATGQYLRATERHGRGAAHEEPDARGAAR